MNQRQWECLLSVSETGSFAKAGERLFMSQPGISKQIRSLEAELGFPLFVRNSHRVELTPAGAVIRDMAQRITADIVRSVSEASALSETDKDLRLGYMGEFNDYLFPVLFRILKQQHPRLCARINMKRIDFRELSDANTPNKYAGILAFQDARPEETGMTFEPIFEDRHFILLPNDHPLSTARSLSLKDLDGMALILPPMEKRVQHLKALSSIDTAHVLEKSVDGPNIQSAVSSVLLGMGVAIVPGVFRQNNPHLAYVPLEPDIPYMVGMLWGNCSKTSRDNLTCCLVAACREIGIRTIR